ncbi:MAG: TetR/AcrR family transcriptional regulator [Natronohydrobacter sp.]|nr:TetR/AcrR family transcriptional regulator [Natronohydrobacter sp.]
MTVTAAMIRQGRKYDQVLDGARAVFVEMGYERASVDEIARVAGVSKATLYSYFPEKRLLFTEVYRTEILRLADSAVELADSHLPPERALRDAARRILAYLTSDFAQAMYRICVTETPRFPEIGRAFYETGPELGRERLGCYLRAACARGALQIEDIDLAADQFFQLCQTTICDRILCGVQKHFTEAEISRTVEGAVTMFLARYGR